MTWLLTLDLPDERAPGPRPNHTHIDVTDPEGAAVVITTINDSLGYPVHAKLEQYQHRWRCRRKGCSAWRDTEEEERHRPRSD